MFTNTPPGTAERFVVTNIPRFNNPGAAASSATRNADGSIRALNGYGERHFRFAAKISFYGKSRTRAGGRSGRLSGLLIIPTQINAQSS